MTSKDASAPSQVHERLDQIEISLAKIANAVDGSGKHVHTNPVSSATRPERVRTTTPSSSRRGTTNQNPSDAFSPFPNSSVELNYIAQRAPSSHRLDAPKSLRDLTDSLGSINFQTDQVREDAKRAGKSSNLFFIPNKEQGKTLTDSKST